MSSSNSRTKSYAELRIVSLGDAEPAGPQPRVIYLRRRPRLLWSSPWQSLPRSAVDPHGVRAVDDLLSAFGLEAPGLSVFVVTASPKRNRSRTVPPLRSGPSCPARRGMAF